MEELNKACLAGRIPRFPGLAPDRIDDQDI
jgi:hypothetical protein